MAKTQYEYRELLHEKQATSFPGELTVAFYMVALEDCSEEGQRLAGVCGSMWRAGSIWSPRVQALLGIFWDYPGAPWVVTPGTTLIGLIRDCVCAAMRYEGRFRASKRFRESSPWQFAEVIGAEQDNELDEISRWCEECQVPPYLIMQKLSQLRESTSSH